MSPHGKAGFSKHGQRRRSHECDGKTAYGSSAEAEATSDLHDMPAYIAPYRCRFCGAWHLGHEWLAHKASWGRRRHHRHGRRRRH